MPRSAHTIMETQSGFSSLAPKAEPIYITAAKQGKKVAVLSATQSYPPGPAIPNYVSFSGFETEIAKAAMHSFGARIVPVEAYTDLPPGNGPYREIEVRVADTTF